MRRYHQDPSAPDYFCDYPPPPPCDFDNDLPPPPPPPPMRDPHKESFHRDMPPHRDDGYGDYWGAPEPRGGYGRPPPPPRDYSRDFAEDHLDAPSPHGIYGRPLPPPRDHGRDFRENNRDARESHEVHGRPPPPPRDYDQDFAEDCVEEWDHYGGGHRHPRGAPPTRARGLPPMRARGAPPTRARASPPMRARGVPPTRVRGLPPMRAGGHTPYRGQVRGHISDRGRGRGVSSVDHGRNHSVASQNGPLGAPRLYGATPNQAPNPQVKSAPMPGSDNPSLQQRVSEAPSSEPIGRTANHVEQKLSNPPLDSGVKRTENQSSKMANLNVPAGVRTSAQEEPELQRSVAYKTSIQNSATCNMPGDKGPVKVRVPGEANFISFKNSLQEYCQKNHLPVPSYTTFKNNSVYTGFSFSAKVEVARQTFKSRGMHRDRRVAEKNAAFVALQMMGLIPASVEFSNQTGNSGVKRPNPGSSAAATSETKVPKVEPTTTGVAYKSRLNEFCQKFHLPAPKYETVRNSSRGFMTTLVYNNKVFHSTSPQASKKLAEENAAQLVLSHLNQAPCPEPGPRPVIQTNMQTSATGITPGGGLAASGAASGEGSVAVDLVQAAQPFVVSYKNQLQEHCQKRGINHPVYETFNVQGMFGCKVTLEGRTFTSSNCKTKKGSEQSAARLALEVLGPVPPAPTV